MRKKIMGYFGTFIAGVAIFTGGAATAQWVASTPNAINETTDGIHLSDTVTVSGGSAVSCTDTSAGSCSVAVNAASMNRGDARTSSIAIENIGTAPTTNLALTSIAAVSAPTGGTICSDLILTVKDASTSTIYYTGAFAATPASTALPALAPSTTMTVDVTLTLPSSAPQSDAGYACNGGIGFSLTD